MCACVAAGALLLSNNLNSIIMSKGKTSIRKSDVKFFEVLEHDIFQKNRKECKDLSDFEACMLELVGNAIRPRESQHFWSGGCYSWYRDGRQENVDRLWLTKNGILVFEKSLDDDVYRLFRVGFNF